MKSKQINIAPFLFFICFLYAQYSQAQTKFPIKIIFNQYSGLLKLDDDKCGDYFKINSPDSIFYISAGHHFFNIGSEGGKCGELYTSWLTFTVDSNGLITETCPSYSAKILPDRKTLAFNIVKIKIEVAAFKGNRYYPCNYSFVKKYFTMDEYFNILPGLRYFIDNGSFWDSGKFYPKKNPRYSVFSRFYFDVAIEGKINIYNKYAATNPQISTLKLSTVTFKACPCHFGDGYLIFPNKPKDTIRGWTNITLIAAIPTEIIIVDARGIKEINYFYPPRRGVLKRKDMLRKKK